MTEINGNEINLQDAGPPETDARARLRRRLAKDKSPSTRDNTTRFARWELMADHLGQPFDSTKIPLSKMEQMRRDPMIAFALQFVKVPLVRSTWYIKCEDPRIASFVDNALRRIYSKFIMQYCGALDFGFQSIVKRFEQDDPTWTYIDSTDPEAGKKPAWDTGVKAVLWKPFTTLSPYYSWPAWTEDGEFNGIYYNKNNPFPQGAQIFKIERPPDVPLDWALWATNEKDSVFGSLYGYPRSGYAYRYWWSYWYRFALSDRAFERFADPALIVYHPLGEGLDASGQEIDIRSAALDVGEQARSGATVAMPSTVVTSLDERTTNVREWEIRPMEANVNFAAFTETFEYLDVQKLRSIMVPEQALVEGKGGTSSRNVAATFGDFFVESQSVLKAEIDDVINRWMIPQLVEVNFGPEAPDATLVSTGFDPRDVETMRVVAQVIGKADPSKLQVDERELMRNLGVPLKDPDKVAEELKQAAEQAKQDAQFQHEQQLAQIQAQAAARPPTVAPKDSKVIPPPRPPKVAPTSRSAGVTAEGEYFRGRERIELELPEDEEDEQE